ncbi:MULTISPECIES: DNA polymerase III subunit alpha [Clostridium]|uniref:DNA polymerase III subunit alpha n=1 Tax=Clostridium paraputrificum TaxID=29363 RepID=A0A174FF29_9CLOT|nr:MULTISPECIES: DNA polymerase III subunit alpha [Clostridium]MDB2086010.1 DNA polymerase III subunit alpha [Clostridium paraputrificum]MDB2103163.1 DNA polymerase III subunit alpha [Clostridium paraputrificum]MDB2110180.1 DNA polymerase III subunit alpha [Clostridium paraputrificum]MDU1824657.1 DNA polymerase III subunit alpha [Clostridium sp.]MDU1842174.1 DNA polymerase III subunit alpha [Clostridium sp.]
MGEKKFCHLHLHTEYSLLDGSGKVSKIIKRAKELGMDSIAITDHGVMYGCVEFYKQAVDQGIKPILGCEVYVASKSMYIKQVDKENSTNHLVLLVKNEVGYQNLMKIVSQASIDGFYYKPRVDHEYLKKHSEGIIALSACLGGEVQSNILKDNYDKAKEIALLYKDIFKEGFYLELQNHGMDEQRKVNETNIKISKETGIPLVATNDVHYINQKDSKSHDILMCIQTGKTVEDENRRRYPSDQFYLKSPEEMWDMFSYIPEALENTIKIAEECNYDYKFHESKLPKFPLPEGTDPYEYLKETCYKGLIERYDVFESLRNKELNYQDVNLIVDKSKKAKEYVDRLEYELGIIKQMGYVDYFLIVWDFIRFSNENGIPTGPGRGSAAGSIVAYTLGITKIDPIKYSLLFERFLNPERVSMPDIDSDFCYERRQEVIDYVVEKYGVDNVSQIITFGTMAPRACIRDVGRAMNYPYAEVDKISKMIPTMLGITIDKALELNPELKNEYDTNDRVRALIDVSKDLEGLPRHSSTHAAGVVIASKPLVEYVPLQKNEEMIVTQFGMTTLEELGLLKMDFLGLRTLTVMNDAVKMIKENQGVDIDLDKINFEDEKVYKMLGEGKTAGVFQLESAGMTSFMKELKPDSLEDIIAGISLYRPGPMSEIPRYVECKNNPDKVNYIVPELEDILDVTYGVMVYQEQVMEIVRKLGGYSMGRSDMVRRAMSKKKHKVMEEERKNFIYGITDENGHVEVPGCVRNGISEEAGNKIFDTMMDFASYAFNKSHAAAYAVVGYQTAYLMRYYPVETIAAMLNSVMGTAEKVSNYIKFAESQGIQVLPPDINESYSKFTVKGDSIRFGLAAIKNVGWNVVESIVKSRKEKGKFTSLEDLIDKIDLTAVNKRAIESLIKAGALDGFKVFRSRLLAVFEKVMDGASNERKRNIDGQMSLFGLAEDAIDIPKIVFPNIKEFDKRHILLMEKEMTGLYLSGHPLDEYKQSLKLQTSTTIETIEKSYEIFLESINAELDESMISEEPIINDNDTVIVGGILTEVNQKVTRNNTMMAFLKLEDLTGTIEVIVFPKALDRLRDIIKEDTLVKLKGRVSIKEDELPKIICENIEGLEKINGNKLYIRVKDKGAIREASNVIKNIIGDYLGNTPIYLFDAEKRQNYRLSKDKWINEDDEVIENLKNHFGEENVKLIEG